MVKISIGEDCGNAPKKQYIKEFLIACVSADIETASGMVADTVQLSIPGHAAVDGKEQAVRLLQSMVASSKVSELVVHNIISHGDRCAANGVIKLEGGSEVAFGSVYVFSNFSKSAKLKEVTIYPVVMQPDH